MKATLKLNPNDRVAVRGQYRNILRGQGSVLRIDGNVADVRMDKGGVYDLDVSALLKIVAR